MRIDCPAQCGCFPAVGFYLPNAILGRGTQLRYSLAWLVLVARRHITAVDELTNAEAIELGQLIHRTSVALKEVTGCVKTYVIQFAERADHPHVHFHIIPRMAGQPENRYSTQIFGYLGVPKEERVNQEAMNAIAVKVREVLLAYTVA